jgi:hypothetical protein
VVGVNNAPATVVIRTQLEYYQSALRGWQEPNGLLVPTEPDANTRARLHHELTGAIHALRWVLGETQP